jgi:hypothetical protein
VTTPLGSTAVRAEFAQMVGVSAGVVLQMASEEVWEHECGSRELLEVGWLGLTLPA